ncbi:uncharacterized protein LALA0_S13e03378g [Lachancea lanzarotensis]|uniref:LALA0S13e03378g1_1 n=1 Tax=Lachancea lanzarotensis TaxID=1245769 RepID=A0A0C7NEM4_9SACH|nr:uncharacterized protein LALA0_S13e03378g [Lachancea lanzarotensis]CEP64804.1 LALA0S13e03378g1_1 [Lachancea lanzarotensis]
MGSCASKQPSTDVSNFDKPPSTQPTRKTQKTRVPQPKTSLTQKVSLKTEKPGVGKTLGTLGDDNKERSARSAAGIAATERLEKSQKHLKNGDLGKKLIQERSKTMNTHLKDNAESRRREREKPLTYD